MQERNTEPASSQANIPGTGSENVFNLGFGPPKEPLLKSRLMHVINSEIRKRGWSQDRAASMTGLCQPELSRIANGRGTGFSADRLFNILIRLHLDVDIAISPGSGALHVRERSG